MLFTLASACLPPLFVFGVYHLLTWFNVFGINKRTFWKRMAIASAISHFFLASGFYGFSYFDFRTHLLLEPEGALGNHRMAGHGAERVTRLLDREIQPHGAGPVARFPSGSDRHKSYIRQDFKSKYRVSQCLAADHRIIRGLDDLINGTRPFGGSAGLPLRGSRGYPGRASEPVV